MFKLLGALCFGLLLKAQVSETNKTRLRVGALLELSGHPVLWKYQPIFIDILEHGFYEGVNRTDLLLGYEMELIIKDTEGESGRAARRLFELLSEEPPVVAVLGPSLSKELTVVGQITPEYNILHLSYVATTSSTSDRDTYSTLFNVNQILNDLNPLRIKMMQYFGWTRVGTLFFGDDINTSHMNLFHDLLKRYNFTLVTSAVVSNENADIKTLIARLLQYDVRIIMASFRNTKASVIFCEAYKQGLLGKHFVWILPGPGLHQGWMSRIDFNELDCTYEQFLEATDGHITLNYDRFDSRNVTTISGSTPSEIKAYFEARVAETEYLLSSSFAWVYDTAWALAIGLNNSLKYLDENGLHNYTNNKYYLDAIMKGMLEVNFQGASGPVSFDSAGSRAGNTFIEQNFNDTRIRVAMYDQRTDVLQWFVPPESLWPHGEIPADRFTYHSVMVEPSIPALVLVTIGDGICVVVALGFLSFNIYFRNNSNIKLSSPMINNVILGGSIMMFICVFITSVDYGQLLSKSLDDHICMIRIWIMCLGFTSLFGALFSKTWRVHKIFRDYKFKKTSIKDWHLFGIIIFLLAIDCILLITWSSTHSLRKTRLEKKILLIAKVAPNKILSFYSSFCDIAQVQSVHQVRHDVLEGEQVARDELNHNNVISEVYTYCHHPQEGYWFVTMYIYKGLLLVFGTFLSWETRHVTVPALNDSKLIGFCIYNVVIVCIFGVPLMHVLPTEQTTLNYVLLSAFVMFCTTMCLCILFVPKIKMRNQVNGRFLTTSMNEKAAVSTTSASYNTQMKRTEQSIIIGTEGSSFKETVPDKEEIHTTENIKNAINKLRKRIADDTLSMEKLKRDLRQLINDGKSAEEGDTNTLTVKKPVPNSDTSV